MLYIFIPVLLHHQQFFLKVISKHTKYKDQEFIKSVTCCSLFIHITHSLWGKTVKVFLWPIIIKLLYSPISTFHEFTAFHLICYLNKAEWTCSTKEEKILSLWGRNLILSSLYVSPENLAHSYNRVPQWSVLFHAIPPSSKSLT